MDVSGTRFPRIAAVLLCSLPCLAQAFTETTIQLPGVKITAVASATNACGVDFLISVSDNDQHFVVIEYTYNGTFNIGTPSFPDLRQTSKSSVININVGFLTYGGMLARPPGNTTGLVCNKAWAYNFRASQDNISQKQRNTADEQRRQQQAREDERERRRQEQLRQQEESRRRAQQSQEDLRRAMEQAERGQLEAYKRMDAQRWATTKVHGPCLISSKADIPGCEEAWRHVQEDMRREAQHNDELRRKREDEERFQQFLAENERRLQQEQREQEYRMANACASVEPLRRSGPPTQPYPANATPGERANIDAINQQNAIAFSQKLLAVENRCRRDQQAQQQLKQQQQPVRQPVQQTQQTETRRQQSKDELADAIADLINALSK